MSKYLGALLVASLAVNGSQLWLLRQAWRAEAEAVEACNTRVERSARESEAAAREAERAVYESRLAEMRSELDRSRRAVAEHEAVDREIEEVTNDRIEELRAARAEAETERPGDCAARPIPADLLERLRPDA